MTDERPEDSRDANSLPPRTGFPSRSAPKSQRASQCSMFALQGRQIAGAPVPASTFCVGSVLPRQGGRQAC